MSAAVPFARHRLRRAGASALALGVTLASAIGLGDAGPARSQAAPLSDANLAGQKGAQVYCFMRNNGNIHEVSWAAAYALIKRQSSSLFKTSPEHASVMITEAVVQNPGTYPDCGRYLGDLYTRRRTVLMTTTTGAASPGLIPGAAAAGAAAPGGPARW